jgi:hypothetical protein
MNHLGWVDAAARHAHYTPSDGVLLIVAAVILVMLLRSGRRGGSSR